ncbi:MAG: helix-turn-helix transcriptional regulator, partial [Dongiaceae bacterium]
MSNTNDRFVADDEAGQLTSLSRSQRHRMTTAGQFPRKRQITPGRSAYLLSEINA